MAAEKEEDRISEFPDCILLIILSLLGSTKEACKTCLLSKRWQFLWLHISEIDLCFWESKNSRRERRRFINFVTKMLSMRIDTGTHLNKFAINLNFEHCFAEKVNKWVDFAIDDKVENIELMLGYNNQQFYLLPQKFYYANSSLTSLSLSSCDMAPHVSIHWECLKSLFLYSVLIELCVLENILSGCPVLEVLSLIRCWFPNVKHCNLNIRLPSLTTLTIQTIQEYWGDIVCEISAPYVTNLSLHSCSKSFFLKNVSSVVRANLELNREYCEELLQSLKFVKELEFGTRFLDWYGGQVEIQIPELTQLRCLTLNVDDDKRSIPGIIAFLGSAPNLETLFINGDDDASYDHWYVNMDFTLSRLTTIEITNFIEDGTGEAMLTLVQILLEKAEVLQKMVIKEFESRVSSTDLSKISDKLYTFPRASNEAIIEFDI